MKMIDDTKLFNVFTTQGIDIDLKGSSKSTYSHWAEGLTMYITKDGNTMVLNSDEIQELVKSLPRTIGGQY